VAAQNIKPVSAAPVADTIDVTVTEFTTADEVVAFASAQTCVAVVGAWDGRPGRSPLTGIGLCPPDATNAAAWITGALLGDAKVAAALNELFAKPSSVAAADAKTLMRSLLPLGIDIPGLSLDA